MTKTLFEPPSLMNGARSATKLAPVSMSLYPTESNKRRNLYRRIHASIQLHLKVVPRGIRLMEKMAPLFGKNHISIRGNSQRITKAVCLPQDNQTGVFRPGIGASEQTTVPYARKPSRHSYVTFAFDSRSHRHHEAQLLPVSPKRGGMPS